MSSFPPSVFLFTTTFSTIFSILIVESIVCSDSSNHLFRDKLWSQARTCPAPRLCGVSSPCIVRFPTIVPQFRAVALITSYTQTRAHTQIRENFIYAPLGIQVGYGRDRQKQAMQLPLLVQIHTGSRTLRFQNRIYRRRSLRNIDLE